MLLSRIATCISYSADSCFLSHKGIILLMLTLTYEGLAGIKRLILLLYTVAIWLDAAVKRIIGNYKININSNIKHLWRVVGKN